MSTENEDTAVRPICYTDTAGRACGQPAVAVLAIVPVGDGPAPVAGRVALCMNHLVALMYTNGVGPQELADVVTALSWHIARGIAAQEQAKPGTRGRARPIPPEERP